MDFLDQLRIFVRVANSGGFTNAADQMNLPRPTVSLAIQQLEARMGARLLNRTTRRVSLTQDGEALLERAESLVAEGEELEKLFLPTTRALQGRLRVDLPSRIARCIVAPALPAFLDRHPGFELELGSSDRAIDLVHEGVDCALRIGEMKSSSLVTRKLGAFTLINCASPSYLAHYGTPQQPSDLSSHFAVNYASPTDARPAPWEWIEKGERQKLFMSAKVSVNNAETYIACCLAGMGLIQIPEFDVREYLQNGSLVEVMLDWRAPPIPVQLIYPHRRYISRRMKVFSDWMVETIVHFVDSDLRRNKS